MFLKQIMLEFGESHSRSHESDCLFKSVPCPHTACVKMVPLAQLESHVVLQHKVEKIDGFTDGQITMEWPAHVGLPLNNWELTLVLLNGLMIFPMIFKRDNVYYVWLKMVNTSYSEAEYSLKGLRGCFSYTGRLFDIETTTTDLLRNQEHILTFTNTQAKQCMTKDSRGRDVICITFRLIDESLSVEKNIFAGATAPADPYVDRARGN
jgi:hypothetical protein